MIVMVLSITGPVATGSITAAKAPFAFVRGEPLATEAVRTSSITRPSTPQFRNSRNFSHF